MSTIILDLKKGDTSLILDLTKESPDLKKLKAELRWDPHPAHPVSRTDGFDIDLYVLACDRNGNISSLEHVNYFKNKWNTNRSVGVPNDNRFGGADKPEYALFDIPNLPTDRETFELFAVLHEGAERKQNFGQISNAHIDIIDDETGKVIRQYNLSQNYSAFTAVHIGSLKRKTEGGFEFVPEGVGAVMGPQDVINAYAG